MFKTTFRVAAFILAVTSFLLSQTEPKTTADPIPGLPPEMQQKLEQLAKIEKAIQSRTMNSPGFDITFQEKNRTRTADRTLVTYRLTSKGFSAEQFYELSQLNLDGTLAPVMSGISFSTSGEAMCAGNRPGACVGDKENDPIDFKLFAAKGEPKRFALVSQDGQAKAFTETIPFPISATDHACALQLILGTPDEELVYVVGNGFPASTDAVFYTKSYEEVHSRTVRIDGDGSYFTIMLPYVAGKNSGRSIVQLKSKTCAPQITFQWGKSTYHLE